MDKMLSDDFVLLFTVEILSTQLRLSLKFMFTTPKKGLSMETMENIQVILTWHVYTFTIEKKSATTEGGLL